MSNILKYKVFTTLWHDVIENQFIETSFPYTMNNLYLRM